MEGWRENMGGNALHWSRGGAERKVSRCVFGLDMGVIVGVNGEHERIGEGRLEGWVDSEVDVVAVARLARGTEEGVSVAGDSVEDRRGDGN